MGKGDIWLSSVYLIRDVILQPGEVFKKAKNGEIQREALIVFGVAALIPLFKSFSARRRFINFFADERLNQLLSTLSIPQIKWLVTYVAYFGLIYVIFGICRLFNREANLKSLMIAFLSLGGVGIASQIMFYPLQFVLPRNIIFLGSYFVYLLVIGLSIRAVQVTQGLSFSKALVSFFPPAVILTLILGMTAVSPYLAWLTT